MLREPDAIARGRLANSPREIPWRGWRAVIRRTFWEMLTDRVSLVAAGCAFYGTLALFPAMSMLISLYGLLFDPATVEPQLTLLRDLLPPSTFTLISDRIHMLVTRPPSTLGLGLVISTSVALWSSASGIKSIITALNLAYEEREQRNFLHYQVTAFTITGLAILSAVFGLMVLVGLPAALGVLRISGQPDLLAAHIELRPASARRADRVVAALSVRAVPPFGAMALGDARLARRDRSVDHRLGAVFLVCRGRSQPMTRCTVRSGPWSRS